MSRTRKMLRLTAALALVLFVGWLGAGLTHVHADNPTCQVCKLLHSGAADLAQPAAAPTPDFTHERFALLSDDSPTDRFIPHPHGRGPPTA